MATMNHKNKQSKPELAASLREEEIRYILLAADSLIGSGGRSMLAKILKGSRDKKLLELELNTNVAYGYYSYLTLEQITERVDWMIKNDFLELEYNRDMPLLIFTEKGWLIQCDQLTDLLLHQWSQWIEAGTGDIDMSYLKDRNRGMILLFLQKVAGTSDERFIPLLKQWHLVDYQKVKKAIMEVIAHLQNKGESRLVLEGAAPQVGNTSDLFHQPREAERLKCWECGKRFEWMVEEQDVFRMRGWEPPKRCSSCREERRRQKEGFTWNDFD
ncbi:RQC-minor-1 family DNA-binding protein [Paenibacillus alginolyticus]|uniref:RQC-minor-1 family DNA-binding protein n=1 Tax=Paenibacillus alginolyticus TaxID=59839 RepID=UPI001FEAC7C3|nr:RQC-minor-1 family DNA-binding protein [Paenibacillus frigoriresistens]